MFGKIENILKQKNDNKFESENHSFKLRNNYLEKENELLKNRLKISTEVIRALKKQSKENSSININIYQKKV